MSITEQPIGEVSAPTDLTEATEVATSTPVNLTEQATGSVAIPSTITPESIPTTNPSGAIIGYNNVLLSGDPQQRLLQRVSGWVTLIQTSII